MYSAKFLKRFARDKRAATAVVVAATLPVLIATMGGAVDFGLVRVREGQLQNAAEAAAAAAREAIQNRPGDISGHGDQAQAVTAALQMANLNLPQGATATVQQGWWDTTKSRTLGDAQDAQTFIDVKNPQLGHNKYVNAIRVVTQMTHDTAFGRLIGYGPISLAKAAIGYKCTNFDEPVTRVQDDANPPPHPALYGEWSIDGSSSNQSWYYISPRNGRHMGLVKIWAPADGLTSFVVSFDDGDHFVQVETYCRGTYVLGYDDADIRDFAAKHKDKNGNYNFGVLAGNTNNDWTVYPNQAQYPLSTPTAVYNVDNAQPIPDSVLNYDPKDTKMIEFPNAGGVGNWVYRGNPTPSRRTVLVQ